MVAKTSDESVVKMEKPPNSVSVSECAEKAQCRAWCESIGLQNSLTKTAPPLRQVTITSLLFFFFSREKNRAACVLPAGLAVSTSPQPNQATNIVIKNEDVIPSPRRPARSTPHKQLSRRLGKACAERVIPHLMFCSPRQVGVTIHPV